MEDILNMEHKDIEMEDILIKKRSEKNKKGNLMSSRKHSLKTSKKIFLDK